MTPDRMSRLISAYRRDHLHAIRALAHAETDAARRRHSRRAMVAERAIASLQRDLERATCETG